MLKQVLEALDRKIHHTLELVQAGMIASIELRLANHRKLSAIMFSTTEVNFASLLSLGGGAISYSQIVKHATVVDNYGTMGVIININNDIATVITAITAPDIEGLTRLLNEHDSSPHAHGDIRQAMNEAHGNIRQSVVNAHNRADEAHNYCGNLETTQGAIVSKIPANASANNKLATQEDISNFTSVADLQDQLNPEFGQPIKSGVSSAAARSDHAHALPPLPSYTGNGSIRSHIGLGIGQGTIFQFNPETGELVIRV
ncbi:MAG: hypothetical protein FWD49_04135 [Firmicutes bacterium]|nr:hypothetical protein [Bacillota bacterium]